MTATANNKHQRTLELKIPPPVLAAILALAMWLPALLRPGAGPAPLAQALGGPIAMLGGVISVLGIATFWHAQTTINPMHPERSTHLVTSGIFHYSRNPMYLGLVITLTGWAVHLPSALAFLGPVAFGVYIHHFQILPEERILAAVFGAEYEHYKARVRRWL